MQYYIKRLTIPICCSRPPRVPNGTLDLVIVGKSYATTDYDACDMFVGTRLNKKVESRHGMQAVTELPLANIVSELCFLLI